jgi:hypothetical protein
MSRHHVYLVNRARLRDLNPSLDHVVLLFDPWAVPTQMVQYIPIFCDGACTLPTLLFSVRAAPCSLRVPPAAPAGLMRLSNALILRVAGVLGRGICRTEGRVLDGEECNCYSDYD